MALERVRQDLTATRCAPVLLVAFACGCSASSDASAPPTDDPPPPPPGSAGTSATGGAATGGATGSGLTGPGPATGGGVATGGTPGTGATTGSGGFVPGGGAVGTGGAAIGTGAAPAGGGTSSTCTSPSTVGGAPLRDCNLPGTCGDCIRSNACELFTFQCAPDADCVCMAECIATASLAGVSGCLGTCSLSGSPPGFAELAEVIATMCPDGDECSAPPGFVPPPPMESTTASNASIGGGTLPDCSLDPGLPFDPNGTVLQLQSLDGSVCVRLERRNDGPGSNANTAWTLIDMRVGPLGEVCYASDPGTVCWHSSHHNFDDWAHAWCGSRHYDVNADLTGHGAFPTYQLHVFEAGPLGVTCAPTADGTCPIGQPIDLVPFP